MKLLARLGAGAGALLTVDLFGAVAAIGGLALISYGAYMILPAAGVIVAGVALLVLGKVATTPTPSESDDLRPDRYEGARRMGSR